MATMLHCSEYSHILTLLVMAIYSTYHGYTHYYSYERFCSAFPDVDSPFGGAGDFFGVDFEEGSFEARPG